MIASRSLAIGMRCKPASSPSIIRRYAHTRTQKAPAAQRRADNWLDDVEPLRKPAAARTSLVPFGLPAPRQLVAHLDDHVIGQERAKKYLAVALFNHYVRVLSNEENDQAGDFEAGAQHTSHSRQRDQHSREQRSAPRIEEKGELSAAVSLSQRHKLNLCLRRRSPAQHLLFAITSSLPTQ